MIDKYRPVNVYSRALTQLEEERSGNQNTVASSSTPPRKTHEADREHYGSTANRRRPKHSVRPSIIDDIKDSLSDHEVTSEVSQTFLRLHTANAKEEEQENRETAVRQQSAKSNTDDETNDTPQISASANSLKPEPEISQEMYTSDKRNIRGMSKCGIRVKQTQFYRFQIDSTMSGISVIEHDTTISGLQRRCGDES